MKDFDDCTGIGLYDGRIVAERFNRSIVDVDTLTIDWIGEEAAFWSSDNGYMGDTKERRTYEHGWIMGYLGETK